MNLRASPTRRNIIIGIIAFVIVVVAGGFLLLRRPPRVAMERYVPADVLAFVEIDSLADVMDGLTRTRAWTELAPVLGLSSQLRQVGLAADLIGRTGIGPDEAVIAGRAQLAVAITGIESNAGETEAGPYLHVKPDFALIIETHMKPDSAAKLVRDRGPLVAQRLYGESMLQDSEEYQGSRLLVFQGSAGTRRLVVTSSGGVVLAGNGTDSVKRCLDAIEGRASTLADDSTLKQRRADADRGSTVFAFISAKGIERIAELSPLLFRGGLARPDTVGLLSDLLQHLSRQAVEGLLYSSQFDGD